MATILGCNAFQLSMIFGLFLYRKCKSTLLGPFTMSCKYSLSAAQVKSCTIGATKCQVRVLVSFGKTTLIPLS